MVESRIVIPVVVGSSPISHPSLSSLRRTGWLDWCRDKMAGYKRPRGVSFMTEAEMPRTATGKIQHRLLRDKLSKRAC